ncbi:fungal-specific transcription factor domain-containing protein [Aspergillus caelatus]|uniref:Fungal-specific transcription factor domain-containing protein n=1 Tax=Aspergillus caelatus TaxID=61420 RepID=A0A5N6ZIT2_9EURO|nr:fungal-specific transcription factor domain-containing protein [Aspergillus caelatus]KAE8357521.1 fungal-specific transcription factor domain-containing protein [Aspergillus caelatus]
MSRSATNNILYAEENSKLPELSVACSNCRNRKLRCSRETPACQHCRKTGSHCVYDPKRAKPGIKSGAIENIHRRLELQTRLTCPPLDRLEDFVLDRLGDNTPDESNQRTQPSANQSTAGSVLSALARELQAFNDKPSPEAAGRLAKRQRVDAQVGHSRSSLPDVDRRLVLDLLNPNTIEDALQTYFKYIHPWIPLVHENSLRRRLFDPRHRSKLDVLVRAMILVSGRFIQRHEAISDISVAGLATEQARSLVVSTSMDCLSVENLQALVICVFNDIGNGWGEKAWSLVGSLTRTVEYLKLTVEDEDCRSRTSIARPFISLSPPQSWVEAEERRRVFWNVFNLDRFCSVAMGWNTSLTSDDVHRRLPCDGVYWRRDKPKVTAFFGIWDKSAVRMGNPVTFHPAHYVSPQGTVTHEAPEQSLADPSGSVSSPEDPLMEAAGAFAYRIEATESLSRVTTYFLQQKIDTHSPENVTSWLTRFKELDLRLVHWKMLLPKKWKAANSTNTTVGPYDTTNQDGPPSGSGGAAGLDVDARHQTVVMDPNLTLAHITHNASMILLHQPIAFPPHDWAFRSRLPSSCSAETCQQAAVEIATITEQYLKMSPATFPVYPQFSFCVYVAGRLLLAYRIYYSGESTALYSRSDVNDRFWTLVRSLDEMSRRWNGNIMVMPETTSLAEDLAAKYASKLREMNDMCTQGLGYKINVLDYTQDIDHCNRKIDRIVGDRVHVSTPNDATRQPYLHLQAQSEHNSQGVGKPKENHPNDNLINAAPAMALPCPSTSIQLPRNPNDQHQTMYGQETNSPGRDPAPCDLGAISQVLLGHQFMDLDRIISFDNGMFTANLEQYW